MLAARATLARGGGEEASGLGRRGKALAVPVRRVPRLEHAGEGLPRARAGFDHGFERELEIFRALDVGNVTGANRRMQRADGVLPERGLKHGGFPWSARSALPLR